MTSRQRKPRDMEKVARVCCGHTLSVYFLQTMGKKNKHEPLCKYDSLHDPWAYQNVARTQNVTILSSQSDSASWNTSDPARFAHSIMNP